MKSGVWRLKRNSEGRPYVNIGRMLHAMLANRLLTAQQSSLTDTADQWEAVVIGAGPAGAVASYLLARHGLATLLVEAKAFPRSKVCGGCLNHRAVAALRSIGLGDALDRCDASRIDSVELLQGSRRSRFAVPAGVCVSRATFDASLVAAAVEAGATFLPQTRAQTLPAADADHRVVQLAQGRLARRVRARIVLACDGLGHSSVRHLPDIDTITHPQSRVGLGIVCRTDHSDRLCPAGTIRMIVAAEGYVGLARCEASQLCLAAAVDPRALAGAATPLALLQQILEHAGIAADGLFTNETQPVQGTLPLTQHATRVSDERLLLVGDGAGYVEPFTGEGMAAAIVGAIRVAPIAIEAAKCWDANIADRWQRDYQQGIRSRYRVCQTITQLLRYPLLVRVGLLGIQYQPRLASSLARWIAKPSET